MTVQINNESRRSMALVTGIIVTVLTNYLVSGDHSSGKTYDSGLKIEWRTEEGILIFTVTDW